MIIFTGYISVTIPSRHSTPFATYHILLFLSREFRAMQQWKSFGLNFYWCHNCVQSATRNLQLATGNVQLVARLHFLRFALKSWTHRQQSETNARAELNWTEQNRERREVSSLCPRKNLNKVALLVGCAGFELHCVLATRYLVGAVNLSAICIFILLYFVAAFE